MPREHVEVRPTSDTSRQPERPTKNKASFTLNIAVALIAYALAAGFIVQGEAIDMDRRLAIIVIGALVVGATAGFTALYNSEL